MRKLLIACLFVALSSTLAYAQTYGLLPGGTYPNNYVWTGTNTFNGTVSGVGINVLFGSPPSIGAVTPAPGAFTNLSSSGTVSGTGFSNYLISPPPIGGGTANTGRFSNFSATGTLTLPNGSISNTNLANSSINIGGVSTSLGGTYNPSWINGLPNNITVTTPTTAKMAGFNVQITPNTSGVVAADIRCDTNDTAGTTSVSYQIAYGTGTPPATNAAATGTTTGHIANPTISTTNVTLSVISLVTGLAIGTPAWFDLQITAASGNVQCNNISVLLQEK